MKEHVGLACEDFEELRVRATWRDSKVVLAKKLKRRREFEDSKTNKFGRVLIQLF